VLRNEEDSGQPRVLVVDDELQIRRFLRIALEANGYRVYETDRGGEAVQEAARLRPDLVILDIGLPDMDGLEVLRRLREWTPTPVIMLSVRDADRDKVAALDAGADDYLTKPFSVDELLARLRVAQRHARPESAAAVFTQGDVVVDLSRTSSSCSTRSCPIRPSCCSTSRTSSWSSPPSWRC